MDISPLAHLKNLERVYLGSIPGDDYSPLFELKGLKYLHLSREQIYDDEKEALSRALPGLTVYME